MTSGPTRDGIDILFPQDNCFRRIMKKGRLTDGRDIMTGTVLVIDDQELVRAVVSRFLARNGYSVAAAGTGQQAVDALNWHQPAMVIADAEMLTDDGVLVERLRADCADVPLVVMADSGKRTLIDGV